MCKVSQWLLKEMKRNSIPLSPILLLFCKELIFWMLWKKYQIWEVIHSPSKIQFFQWILAWSLAPINRVFFEGGENCASTISMVHLGLLFHILGYSLTFFGSKLQFQGLLVYAYNWSYQFWWKKSSTSSLFQIHFWGFNVSFFLWVCWY